MILSDDYLMNLARFSHLQQSKCVVWSTYSTASIVYWWMWMCLFISYLISPNTCYYNSIPLSFYVTTLTIYKCVVYTRLYIYTYIQTYVHLYMCITIVCIGLWSRWSYTAPTDRALRLSNLKLCSVSWNFSSLNIPGQLRTTQIQDTKWPSHRDNIKLTINGL